MKEAIIQRINTICSKKAKSIRDFSSQIGINNSTLIQQLKGSRSLSLDTINAILFTFEDISAEWLLRGEGSMCKIDNFVVSPTKREQALSNEIEFYKDIAITYQSIAKDLRKRGDFLESELTKLSEKQTPESGVA